MWFIQKIVTSFVISFIMKQLEQFKNGLDWGLVRKDLHARVRSLIPGTFFDDEACGVVDAALSTLETALSQDGSHIQSVLELLAGQQYSEAATQLKDLMFSQLSQPHLTYNDDQNKVRDLLVG